MRSERLVNMDLVDQGRKRMHKAEDALKYYALSGGMELAEYARLLDAAKAARYEFLQLLNGRQYLKSFGAETHPVASRPLTSSSA